MAKTTKRSKSTGSKSVKRPRAPAGEGEVQARAGGGSDRHSRASRRGSRRRLPRRGSRAGRGRRRNRGGRRLRRPRPVTLSADSIFAWEDDPGAPTVGTPIERPIPVAPTHGLATALRITRTVPTVGQHSLGSAGFRYWTAVEALERASAFWASISCPAARAGSWVRRCRSRSTQATT